MGGLAAPYAGMRKRGGLAAPYAGRRRRSHRKMMPQIAKMLAAKVAKAQGGRRRRRRHRATPPQVM